MAKLTIFALLFAASMISLAAATTYTTVITTTTTTEDENPRGQSCQMQMQPQMISHCRMWITKEKGGYAPDEEPFLRSENPMEQHLRQCCDQLQNIKSECRCEAIRSMMREMPSQQYGAKMQEMMDIASSIPGRFCRMKSPSYCPMKQMYL